MNYFITGGAGFVGSHLADALLLDGNHVVALDNFSTGRRDNLSDAKRNPRFRLVEGSILDEHLVASIIEETDVIFHLAASVGVKFVLEHLVETLDTNARGTEVIVRLAQRGGGKKVVLTSTSEVYGKSPNLPHKEDDDLTIGPTTIGRWGYACSKMMDEHVALAYAKEYGLPVVVLRLFNTVGTRQSGRYGMVIPRFVSQALTGEPITVYGDGSQTRCFVQVDRVVRAMIDISRNPDAEGQVFNVGSNQEITIQELANSVKNTLGSTSPIAHVPYERAFGTDFEDIRKRVPDISKIQRQIDFDPTTDLTQLIQEIAKDLSATNSADNTPNNRSD